MNLLPLRGCAMGGIGILAFSLVGESIAIARLCNERNKDTCFFADG